MLISKDILYKYIFYIYFILLPIVAGLEAFLAGSNKIFNGIFLIVFLLSIFDIYRRSYMDKYILLFFAFVGSIFLANSLVYGFNLSSDLNPSMVEGMVVGSRVLLLVFVCFFSFLMVRHGVLQGKDFIYVASYLVLVVAVGQLFGESDTLVVQGEGNELALHGLTGHVAITASILLSVLPILFVYSSKSKLSLVMLLLCFIAIVFTFRRSAWLILTLLGSIHLYLMYFKNSTDAYQKLKVMGFVVVGLLGVVLLAIFNQGVSDAIMTRLEDLNVSSGGTGAGRSIFWGILWTYIFDQPLINFTLGNGYGFIQGLLENKFGSAIGAHNDWLDYFLSFGMMPLILFFAMLMVLVTYVFQRKRKDAQLLGYCVLSLLVLSITTGGAFDTYFAFLHATIGFVLALQHNQEDLLNVK